MDSVAFMHCNWHIHISVMILAWLQGYNLPLFALPIDVSVRQAEVYFEAGDYQRARMQFELLADHLEDWQKMILTYDIGTVLLAQDKGEEAIAAFQTIGGGSKALPALEQRLTANRALARLLLAQHKLQALGKDAAATDEDYQTLILAFRYVLEDIDTAKRAACDLARAEGASACLPSEEIVQMHLLAKELLATLLQSYTDYKASHISMEEGAAMLLAGEGAIIEHLVFLSDPALETELRNQYEVLYLNQAESWSVLWETVEQRIHKDKKVENYKDRQVQFEQARQFFKQGLAFMRQHEFAASEKAFKSSMETLDKLLNQALKDKPLSAALQRLMVTYGTVLGQDPLQEMSLKALEKTQLRIHDLFGKDEIESLKAPYLEVEQYLTAGRQALSHGRQYQARIWVEAARNSLRLIIQQVLRQQLDKPLKQTAKMILENTLSEEQFSLRLSRLLQQAMGRETIPPEVENLIKQSQQHALQEAQKFIPAAIAQQKEEYSQEQHHPWEEIIPIFINGQHAAESAKEKLTIDISPEDAVMLQEVAIKDWKEALDKLQSGTTGSPQKTVSSEAAAPSKRTQTDNQSKVNQVLRLVQEMENEDHSKPGFKTAPNGKGEERPW